MRMVQTGVQRALGARLRIIVSSALSNRAKAVLAGLSVTAILQSSTAAGLMIKGFGSAGALDLAPALAVMLGANIGTTLVVQLFWFDPVLLAPVLVLAGVLTFQRFRAARRDFGRVFIGLGLMLLALHQLMALLQPLLAAPLTRVLLGQLSGDLPLAMLLGLLLGVGLPWAAHSSLATVLRAISLASHGAVPASAALAMVLGANLGAAINPVLEGASGPGGAGRRVALGNLCNRLIGAAVALPLIPAALPVLSALEPRPERLIADVHTAFNLLLAAAFFPWLKTYARVLERLLPARISPTDLGAPLTFAPLTRDAPVITPALDRAGAPLQAAAMADALEGMLQALRLAFETSDRRVLGEIRGAEDVLHGLNRSIKAAVAAIDPLSYSAIDHRRAAETLAFATGLEQAGDVALRSLLRLLDKQLKRDAALPADCRAGILEMIDRVLANARAAAAPFVGGETRAARLLVREKEAFRGLEALATARHYERLREGNLTEAQISAFTLEVVRHLKRINADVVEAAAYPVLEAAGELLPSRLREVPGLRAAGL
jgi:phosphate:Na+ symporter